MNLLEIYQVIQYMNKKNVLEAKGLLSIIVKIPILDLLHSLHSLLFNPEATFNALKTSAKS